MLARRKTEDKNWNHQ